MNQQPLLAMLTAPRPAAPVTGGDNRLQPSAEIATDDRALDAALQFAALLLSAGAEESGNALPETLTATGNVLPDEIALVLQQDVELPLADGLVADEVLNEASLSEAPVTNAPLAATPLVAAPPLPPAPPTPPPVLVSERATLTDTQLLPTAAPTLPAPPPKSIHERRLGAQAGPGLPSAREPSTVTPQPLPVVASAPAALPGAQEQLVTQVRQALGALGDTRKADSTVVTTDAGLVDIEATKPDARRVFSATPTPTAELSTPATNNALAADLNQLMRLQASDVSRQPGRELVGITNDGQAVTTLPTSAPSTPSAIASPASVARIHLDVPVGHQDWGREFSERVGWVINARLPTAQIRLSPEHLGPVEMSIEVDEQQARVQFVAASALTRDALEQNMPRLRDLLEQQGLQLQHADVGGRAQQDSAGGQLAESADSESPAYEADNEVSEVATAATAAPVLRHSGLIDTFV